MGLRQYERLFKRRHLDSLKSYKKRRILLSALACWYLLAFKAPATGTLYEIQSARASFISEAPLEIIKAENTEVSGLIDFEQRTFVIQVKNKGFQGFNSPLQQEHFFENYLETHKFLKSSFKGKLIDLVDLNQPGTYDIRAKGMLDIHGVSQERIIKVQLQVGKQQIQFKSVFSVLLADHQISIPRIVYQKIAEEIKVTVNGNLQARNK